MISFKKNILSILFSQIKMWFVIDPETLQKLGGRFDTQKDLADFLGITPQTLQPGIEIVSIDFPLERKEMFRS